MKTKSQYQYLARIRGIIAKHGLAVQSVMPTETEAGWSYTIGLWPKHGYELLLTLVDPHTAVVILNRMAADVKHGLELPLDIKLEPCPPDGAGTVNAWAGAPVMVRRCDPALLGDRVNVARTIHGTDDFPVLQVVIPDKQGRFPDEPGYEMRSARTGEVIEQPLCYRRPS